MYQSGVSEKLGETMAGSPGFTFGYAPVCCSSQRQHSRDPTVTCTATPSRHPPCFSFFVFFFLCLALPSLENYYSSTIFRGSKDG